MTRVVSLVPISMARQRIVEEREAAKRLARARRRLAALSKANEGAVEPSLTAGQQRDVAALLNVLRRRGLTVSLRVEVSEAVELSARKLVLGQLPSSEWLRVLNSLAVERCAGF